MNIKACASCESKNFSELFSVGTYKIEKCGECSLVRTKTFKSPTYTKYHRDVEYKESESFFKLIFETRYRIITKFVTDTGKILDIGSATGTLLDIFKKNGWKTFGIEPSESYKIAKQKGHTIFHSSLEDLSINEKFDVIVANHVLEHIENPKHFLSICHHLLNDGGILYIDVPNFGSLRSALQQGKWPYLLPNEHVHHFTYTSLLHLMNVSGFDITYSTSRSGVFETSNPLAYLFLELTNFKKNFFADLLMLPFNLIATIVNRGDSIGIVCTKKY